MALNILEQDQGLGKKSWGCADQVHAGIEAMRLSFADALSLVADPEVGPLTTGSVLAEKLERWNFQLQELITDIGQPCLAPSCWIYSH